jgi:hypothetical protein
MSGQLVQFLPPHMMQMQRRIRLRNLFVLRIKSEAMHGRGNTNQRSEKIINCKVFVRDLVLLKGLGISEKKGHIVNFSRVKRTH